MAYNTFELDTSSYIDHELDGRGLQVRPDPAALTALVEHVDYRRLPEQPRVLLVGKLDDGRAEIVAPRDVAFLHTDPTIMPSPRLKDREDIIAAVPDNFSESDVSRAIAYALDRRKQLDRFLRARRAGAGMFAAGLFGGGLGEVALAKPILAVPGMALIAVGAGTALWGAEARAEEREIPGLEELAPPVRIVPKD